MIYEPREDSYLLEKYVKKFAFGDVLDLGTGSGIQALAARKRAKRIIATDINEEAVAFVKQKGIKAVVSDLFENIEGRFDTIIFNPPYLPEDKHEDEESKVCTTGGKHGSEILERFLKEAKKHLKASGQVLLVVSSLTKDAFKIFKKYDYSYKILEEGNFSFETIYICLLN